MDSQVQYQEFPEAANFRDRFRPALIDKCKQMDSLDKGKQTMLWMYHELSLFPPLEEKVCKVGCALCCHLKVEVTKPEMEIIMDFLSALPENKLAEIKSRLGAIKHRTNTLDPENYAAKMIHCPYLGEDNLCAIYEARPYHCRQHHSLRLIDCEISYRRYKKGKKKLTPFLVIGLEREMFMETKMIFVGYLRRNKLPEEHFDLVALSKEMLS